ncbi:MAG: hypothetical protein IH898_14035, partial [Planctomycetes bacterium]|nr:hypothetical protein [Planctomycetota bacterium]
MFSRIFLAVVLFTLCRTGVAYSAENAALHYFYAFILHRSIPDYVASSSTDHPELGFSVPLTENQTKFLNRRQTNQARQYFLAATSMDHCDWDRDRMGLSDTEEMVSLPAHKLARIMLLYARKEFENENWRNGIDYTIRVMKMARHVAAQIRLGENWCYMIENMARGTLCAYLTCMPQQERDFAAARVKELPAFSPISAAFLREEKRHLALSSAIRSGQLAEHELAERLAVLLRSRRTSQVTADFSDDRLAELLEEMAVICKRVAALMGQPVDEFQQAFDMELHDKIKNNPLAMLGLGTVIDLRREDAQADCRNKMFFAALAVLKSG